MPTKKQKNKIFFKRLFWFVFALVFLFGVLAVPTRQIDAVGIQTTSPLDTAKTIRASIENWLKTQKENWKRDMFGKSATIFLMKVVDNFAQRMAQKIAVGIATGAKGGKPLAFTKEMGAYLKDSADAVAGDYIEKLSDEWNVDLCQPDLSLRLKYGLSLYKIEQPDKPKCTFTEMRDNWKEAVNDPDLLKNFSVSFEPEQNDIGIWMQLKGDYEHQKEFAKAVAEKKRGNDAVGGITPKTETVSGNINTPADKISKISDKEVDAAIEAEREKTELAAKQVNNPEWAPMIGNFFKTIGKTLANEVVKNYLAGTYSAQDASNLWKAFCDKNPTLCGKDDFLSNPTAQDTSGGKQAAEAQYAGYIKTNISESGNYDVLAELSSCDESSPKPGPTTCVINSNFASAIQSKLTVSEAIKNGLLDGERMFGYSATGANLTFVDDYPYRSLLILRKYRIIPVGWELAAEYFYNCKKGLFSASECGAIGDKLTLNILIDSYDDASSPYYGLVDPNWVLKLPSGYCKMRGAGPEIIFEQVNEGSDANQDGDFDDENDILPIKTVARNDQYCADEQSCTKEGIDGNCEHYGWCMEEKRLWKFDGDQCDEINNTCQAFVGPDGKSAAYLKNSLDFDGCSKDNSGCQWYCNQFNPKDNSAIPAGAATYNCVANNDEIYLGDSAAVCEAEDAGCNEYLIPENGLIGYWKFDKGDGEVADDSSGYRNKGELKNGAAWVDGKSGKALSFDGGDDYVNVGNVSDGVKTVAFWAKSIITTQKFLELNGSAYIDVANGTVAATGFTSPTIYIDGAVASTIADANWHHIAVTTAAVVNGNMVNIGKVGTTYFSGLIDEVAIYNRALSEQEISNLYKSGIGFSNKYVKSANKNLRCFGRTAGDAYFDLPTYADNCISLGAHFDSYGYNTCFEFLSDKNENDCVKNNGVWSSLVIKIPRHTVQSYCESSGGVWKDNTACVTGGGVCVANVCNDGAEKGKPCNICQTQCLKLDDAVCSSYAFSCKSSEVGCEKYTPTNGDSYVPGVISGDDLCPAECAGYDTYKQESTNFETSQFVNFIPKTAKSCASNNAGCDEFTNIESAGRGGEALEYYQYLRQCEKIPTESADYKCGDFYTWVGSDTTGYQLQSYYLKSDTARDLNNDGVKDEEPVEILRIEEYLGECNDGNDALTNKNCKEFYNSAGVISYHLLKKTITCSDDCISYRKTIPSEFNLKQVCVNIGEAWNVDASTCNIGGLDISAENFCANKNYLDGKWDADSLTCSKTDYKAIPSEGIKCSAASKGCRQYTGNAGNNIMDVFNDNFESESYIYNFPDAGSGWSNGSLSSESTDSNQKSFKVNNSGNSGNATSMISKWLSAKCSITSTCNKDVGCDCKESNLGANDGDSTDETVCKVAVNNNSCVAANLTYDKGIYLLSFWAKGNNGNEITIKIADSSDSAKSQLFENVKLSDRWQEYTLGPLEFDVKGWGNYKLSFENIKSNGGTSDSALGAFFDNIKLQAISDSIYAIKNSWRTPAVCDQDWQGNSYLSYMLGCDEYSDTQSRLHYLKLFSNLCRADAVGCEKLIDIHNFSEPFSKTWNVGDESEITVPARNFVYLAPTQDHSCMQSSVGCATLGKPIFNQDQTIVQGFDEVYKINDPDYYDTSLCLKKNVGCKTFMSAGGEYNFKDPGEKVCEYVQPTYQQDFGWYKKSDSYNINSVKCPTSTYQNFGVEFPSGICVGGVENGKECLASWDNYLEDKCINLKNNNDVNGKCVNGVCNVGNGSCLSKCVAGGGYCNNWAGACVAAQSGCSALVDPISETSISLVANGIFNKDLDTNRVPDNWTNTNGLLSGFNPPAQTYVDTVYADGTKIFSRSPIDIKPNTAYTVSADIKKYNNSNDPALVQIECLNYVDGYAGCPSDKDKGFYFIDGSGELAISAKANLCGIKIDDRTRLIIPVSKLTTDFSRYSMRFFSGTCNKVQLAIGGKGNIGQSFDNVSLKETGVYYYIDSSLNDAKKECNGYVNFEKGCVLLNNRANVSLKTLNFINYLNYNADTMSSSTTSCAGTDNSKFACNADTLMKVKPDRDCNKWLYCTDKEDDKYCSRIEICDKMNKNGQCVSSPLEYSQVSGKSNMTFDVASIDKIKNLSGYSKVGFNWNGDIVEGNLPPSQMTTFGLSARFAERDNGDFELAEKSEVYSQKPIGWDVYLCGASGQNCKNTPCPSGEVCEDTGENKVCRKVCDFDTDCSLNGAKCVADNWEFTDFSLSNNPFEAQQININPVSGNNFLRLTAGGSNGKSHAVSEDVYVNFNTDYALSGYINTSKLRSKDNTKVYGSIKVLENNAPIAEQKIAGDNISIGWNYVQAVFKTKTSGKIKIKLSDVADGSEFCEICNGEIFFDNISIRPVIQTEQSLVRGYTPQSCRRFPQSEAMSCEYENENGYRYRGWYGYCLERDPVYPEYCLNWYPIDDISGGGNNMGESYSGKTPLYYCLEAKDPELKPLLFGGWNHVDEYGSVSLNGKPITSNWVHWRDNIGEVLNLENLYKTDENPGGVIVDADIPKLQYGKNVLVLGAMSNVAGGNTGVCPTTYYSYEDKDIRIDLNGWKIGACGGPEVSKADYDDSSWNNASVGVINGHSCLLTGAGEGCYYFRKVFYIERKIYCKKIVMVVKGSGQNKYWASRLSVGSNYKVPDLGYAYQAYDIPYGSIMPPDPVSDPTQWDGDENYDNKQPIFISSSNTARVANPYSCNGDCDNNILLPNYHPKVDLNFSDGAERVKRLFAESYGTWKWVGTWDNGNYEPDSSISWTPPTKSCPSNGRQEWPYDYCGIAPKVENLTFNGQPRDGTVVIIGSRDVNLKFNSIIDIQQRPLTSYEIQWGDSPNVTGESGVLIDKPSINNPHSFSHEYRHGVLYRNNKENDGIMCKNNCAMDVDCLKVSKSDASFCRVRPTVKITDNWGWTSDFVYGPYIYVFSDL